MFEIGRLARCCGCCCCGCFPPAPRPAKCKIRRPLVHGSWLLAPWPVACCWRSCPPSGHLHRDFQPEPPISLLTCPFPRPILAFSRFLGSNPFLPPQAPQPPAPARPPARRQHRRSFLSFVDLPVQSFVRHMLPHHCIARGRPRMNLPTQQHTHSSPDLQCCCCPGPRRSSHLQLAPGPTMGISSGKR